MPTPEGQIVNSILHYLTISKIWHRRMNTGAFKLEKRFIRFGAVGMADVLCSVRSHVVHNGWDHEYGEPKFLWIEVKTAKGKQSAAQIEFMDEVRHEGHYYLLARSIEDVESAIKEITQ